MLISVTNLQFTGFHSYRCLAYRDTTFIAKHLHAFRTLEVSKRNLCINARMSYNYIGLDGKKADRTAC